MFKYLILVSSVAIALCAALFSVSGIATLFAGKYWTVLVMASSLELGKLVAASFLYRHWNEIARTLRYYLVAGVVSLMFITSVGIYGYLSAGYAAVAAAPQQTLAQISAVESRERTLEDNILRWKQDNTTLESRRRQAQQTLDNVLSGSTELSQRSAFANLRQEISNLDQERASNSQRIQSAQQKKDSLATERVVLNGELNTAGKIGQFVYVARTLNVPLDTIVKWFVLLLVFVFDPLAISLIIAYNTLAKKDKEALTLQQKPEREEEILETTQPTLSGPATLVAEYAPLTPKVKKRRKRKKSKKPARSRKTQQEEVWKEAQEELAKWNEARNKPTEEEVPTIVEDSNVYDEKKVEQSVSRRPAPLNTTNEFPAK